MGLLLSKLRAGNRRAGPHTPNRQAHRVRAAPARPRASPSTGPNTAGGATVRESVSSPGTVWGGASSKTQKSKNTSKNRPTSQSLSRLLNHVSASSSKPKEQKTASGNSADEATGLPATGNDALNDSVGPSEQLDYTDRVTVKDPPDTSHKLLNSYTGEVKGTKDPTRVTVKVLRMIGNEPNDPDFKKWIAAVDQRLREEIGVWMKIKNPFIEYVGFATVGGAPAILTEFVECTSAKEIFPTKSILDKRLLLLEYAAALMELHKGQLVHGNLEPRHFVVDDRGKARLGGFCFNQMIEEELRKVNPSEEYRRSARYTPPEVLENKLANDKSDVYSFACVALELMTGKYPFSTTPQEAAIARLSINGEAHLANDFAEFHSDEWWTTLKLCWSEKPEDRPSMEDLYAMLLNTTGLSQLSNITGLSQLSNTTGISRLSDTFSGLTRLLGTTKA